MYVNCSVVVGRCNLVCIICMTHKIHSRDTAHDRSQEKMKIVISSIFVNLLLLVLSDCVLALPQFYRGRLVEAEGASSLSHTAAEPKGLFFDQRLDHFNRGMNATFRQRYFVNETYWKQANKVTAPVFLCIGGEGTPIDYRILIASVHCNDMVELAPKFGALLVALEHRYYGPSTPNGEYSTENLQFLNTEQALGDIASFVQMIASTYGLTSSNKWVTWGGSYPGMLSALARLRYPHLIHAAVSSSSPLWAQVEMEEYNAVVASSLAAEIVGGSQQCLDVVRDGHTSIGELLTTSTGRKQLEDMFNLCIPGSLEDEGNREQFAGDGVVYFPIQSNDPACTTPYCDIAAICELMTSNEDPAQQPIDKLVVLSKYQHFDSCVAVSYDGMLKAYADPTNPIRSWLYQTCTQWGFYQTCPVGSSCPYTQGLHTLNVDYDICSAAFGISPTAVNEQITNTIALYGGKDVMASRVLYPNGQIDPWSSLGVLTTPTGSIEQPTYWVEGASHHFWTHPTLPTDSEFVVQAREAIWAQVSEWLKEI